MALLGLAGLAALVALIAWASHDPGAGFALTAVAASIAGVPLMAAGRIDVDPTRS